MAKGRDFRRVVKSDQARRQRKAQASWGAHQRDIAAASLGSSRAPSKADLRRQADDALRDWQAR